MSSVKIGMFSAALFLLSLCTTLLNLQFQSQSDSIQTELKPETIARRLNPQMVRALSFGHLPLAGDWLWIRALLDPTTTHVSPGERAELYYFADLVTDLDPANFAAYTWGAMLLTVVRNDNEGARDLLLKARDFERKELSAYPESFRERFWGKSWAIHLTLAYVYLFELNDMRSASRAFTDAAAVAGAPEYLRKLAGRFERPGGEYEVGIRLINFMMSQADQPEAKRKLEKKKLHLFIAQYRHEVDVAFRDFLMRQPNYRTKVSFSKKEMEAYWARFRRENRISATDPWGGKLSLDANGKVTTTTPYEKIFGLD